MSRRAHRRLGIALIGGLAALAFAACRQTPPPLPGAVEAAAAHLLPGPDFELLGLDGETHRLSDFRGQVVLINFWATWCVSCRDEIPDLVALHHELADRGVVIIGIATDAEGRHLVAPYAEEIGMDYPVFLDPAAITAAMFGGVEGYPKTFILDQQGLVYSSYLGAQPPEVFRADLEYLLTAPASAGEEMPDSAVVGG